jgi:integrase
MIVPAATGTARVGEAEIRLHSFRGSYVSSPIANGLDVANVSKYAGDASPTITLDRYAREFEARKRDDDRVREVTAGRWSATAEH